MDLLRESLHTLNLSIFYRTYENSIFNNQKTVEKWGYRRQLTNNFYEEVKFIYLEDTNSKGNNHVIYKISIVS